MLLLVVGFNCPAFVRVCLRAVAIGAAGLLLRIESGMSSHINRNFILAYILLVGLPIVGLLGVLKSGRTLKAPVSIDGVWQLQADPKQLASLPCGKVLAENPDNALAMSQSGNNFTLSLANGPKSFGSGVLDGTGLNASIAPSPEWSEQESCGRGHEFTLVATVDPVAIPRTLVGQLSMNNCSTCQSVPFRAVRQIIPERKASH
jgi:hypothetical protein